MEYVEKDTATGGRVCEIKNLFGIENHGATKTCKKEAGGTCSFFSCHSSRNSKCDAAGKCVCGASYCADENGVCVVKPGATSMSTLNTYPYNRLRLNVSAAS